MPMSIAQGLRNAKRLAGRISTVNRRAQSAVSWTDKRSADFPFDDMVAEEQRLIAERLSIKAAIDLANATHMVTFGDEEMTIATAVRLMRELKGERDFYSKLAIRTGDERGEVLDYDERGRAQFETITWISALTEVERAAKMDKLQVRMDELNDVLETANHTTMIDV